MHKLIFRKIQWIAVLLLTVSSFALNDLEKQELLSNPGVAGLIQQQLGQSGINISDLSFKNISNVSNFGSDSTGFMGVQNVNDTSMLVYPDSAIWVPRTVLDSLDSLRSLRVKDSTVMLDTLPRRYVQHIFAVAPSSIFGSVTSRVGSDYPLKEGDVIVVSIWGDVEKENQYKVNSSGAVFISGVGRISLAGLTLGETNRIIRKKLAKVYSGIRSNKVHVKVHLESLSPIKVFLLGEVRKPGGYVFYGNTGIFQALYQAEGPNNIGSVRNIRVTRDGKTFTVDLYDYLFKGVVPDSSVLMDGDVVYLPRASVLAEVQGDVGRPGIYELDSSEGIRNLLAYAGEVNETVTPNRLVVQRIFPDGSKDFINLESPKKYLSGEESFQMKNGDLLRVDTASELGKHNATILGAIKYPGTYGIKDEKTKVSDLLSLAGGPTEEAYLDRVLVVRPSEDGSYSLLSQSIQNASSDIILEGLDTVIVYSRKAMFHPDSVKISGSVFVPGTYEYYTGMTVKDLVLLAGGYMPDKEKGKIRLDRLEPGTQDLKAHILQMDDDYKVEGKPVLLRPLDHVAVPKNPDYYEPEIIKLRGAFNRPGDYALLRPEETLKSLIERVGGFRSNAYLGGARFFRKADLAGQIGIDLPGALENDRNNITLLNGDSLFVPPRKISVMVRGAVGYPSSVLYKKNESVSYYIRRAGGFTRLADRDHVVLRFANGESTTQSDQYRDPDPGAEIYVPLKPEDPPVSWTQVLSTVATIVSAMATTIVAIVSVQKATK